MTDGARDRTTSISLSLLGMLSNHGRPEPRADRTPDSVLAERRREARHGARHSDVLRYLDLGHHLRRLRADRGPLIDPDCDLEFRECDCGGGDYRVRGWR